MPTYATPGVYFERVDEAQKIPALRTDVAAFVGMAMRGPVGEPVRLLSWQQFVARFGGLARTGYLGYAVKAFFENGGRVCYAVRVASDEAAAAKADVRGGQAEPLLRVEASSPGTWANELELGLVRTNPVDVATTGVQPPDRTASRVASIAGFASGSWVRGVQPGATAFLRVVEAVDAEHDLLVWDEPLPEEVELAQPLSLEAIEVSLRVSAAGRLVESHSKLPLVPLRRDDRPLAEGPLVRVRTHPDAPAAAGARRYFHDPSAAEIELVVADPARPLLAGGRDGLGALTRGDFLRGIAALEPVDEVSILAAPDILIQPAPPVRRSPLPAPDVDICLPGAVEDAAVEAADEASEQSPAFSPSDVRAVQRALIDQCERLRERFTLLDPPLGRFGVPNLDEIQSVRAQFDSKFGALYYPWVLVFDPQSASRVRAIPPSAHVAGVYARVDLAVGVHEPPANEELEWAVGVSAEIDDELHGVLNPIGVNCIRPLAGRGIRVYGARTVSSDPASRFVNVRRLLAMIQEALEEALQSTAFEPNDFLTRQAVATAISSFLEQLWRRGALSGATVEEAFFVKCDEDNNPQRTIDQGKLVADVGVAPVRPAEFVVFRIGRTQDELEVVE